MLMQNPSKPKQASEGILFYLIILTGFFFLLELSFFVQCNKAYLGDFTFVSHHIQIPWRILPGIVYFVFAQLFLHLLFAFIVWFLAYFSANTLSFSGRARFHWALFVFALCAGFVVLANQVSFPNSRVVELSAMLFHTMHTARESLYVFVVLLSIVFALTLPAIFHLWGWKRLSFIALLTGLGIGYANLPIKKSLMVNTNHQPNIILVGVDSLRPDYLGHFGSDLHTPFMDKFLDQATVFTDALTPLARTFPSWTGILTSLYPKHVNVRTNLSDQTKAHLSEALPQLLKKQGYTTLFATDETRFSNISTAFGFEKFVTPPIGLNDFLLGTFNDFPLSNLVVNTRLGQYLFPYSYANRPAYITYDPDSFLRLLAPAISQPQSKPLFLTVHFCLPHSPYLWSHLSGYAYNGKARYAASVERVDQQLSVFFQQLSQAGLLKNAIVVLLSDHGEALELPGDRATESSLFVHHSRERMPIFYPPSMSKESVDESAGHGTDILGLTQYHTVFAVRLYGRSQAAVGDKAGEVSTLDIMPTVLDLAGIQKPKVDGQSLAPVVLGRIKQVPSKPLFVESDYSPQAIRTVYPETRKVFLEGIHLFSINSSTTRLTVKPDMVNKIIHSKQVGIVQNKWMLALYPERTGIRMPILINLNTGNWTNDLHSSFAQHSPANKMMQTLKSFYGNELPYQL